LSENH